MEGGQQVLSSKQVEVELAQALQMYVFLLHNIINSRIAAMLTKMRKTGQQFSGVFAAQPYALAAAATNLDEVVDLSSTMDAFTSISGQSSELVSR